MADNPQFSDMNIPDMNIPDIKLYVGGLKWEGWQEASISRSIDSVFSEFTLKLTLGWPENKREQEGASPPPVRMGQDCRLTLEGETVVTGYINEHDLQADASGFELSITGRDKTALLFKSSVLNKPAEWSGRNALQIAQEICAPFGIAVSADIPVGKPFEKFTVQPGETAMRAIERLARHRALLFFADRFGNLVFTSATAARRAATPLVFGQNGNTLSVRNSGSLSDRNSRYILRGQSQGSNWGTAEHTVVSGEAQDRGVPQYSPRIIIPDEPGSAADLKEIATVMAAVNAGRSLSREYTLAHWTQGPGLPLWDINTLVPVKDDLAKSQGDLLIKSCVYSVSEDKAPETVLTVVPPSTYTLRAEPEKNETGSAWS